LVEGDRSLFLWTPLSLVACVAFVLHLFPSEGGGAATAPRPEAPPRGALAILFVAFGAQVYALASIWGAGQAVLPDAGYAGSLATPPRRGDCAPPHPLAGATPP